MDIEVDMANTKVVAIDDLDFPSGSKPIVMAGEVGEVVEVEENGSVVVRWEDEHGAIDGIVEMGKHVKPA